MTIGHNEQATVKRYVERILEVEKQIADAKEKHIAPLQQDVKDLYKEAGSEGFDKKALKEVVRKTKMAKETREAIDLYEHAILDEMLG